METKNNRATTGRTTTEQAAELFFNQIKNLSVKDKKELMEQNKRIWNEIKELMEQNSKLLNNLGINVTNDTNVNDGKR